MTLYSENMSIEDWSRSCPLKLNGLQPKMDSLLVFIFTKNTIHHGVGTQQRKFSSNTTDWEVKVKNWKQREKKYNYAILDWVLKKNITNGQNTALLIHQLRCQPTWKQLSLLFNSRRLLLMSHQWKSQVLQTYLPLELCSHMLLIFITILVIKWTILKKVQEKREKKYKRKEMEIN